MAVARFASSQQRAITAPYLPVDALSFPLAGQNTKLNPADSERTCDHRRRRPWSYHGYLSEEMSDIAQFNVRNIQITRSVDWIPQLTKMKPTTGNTPTSFLNLPSELRNKIYELIVLHQEPINPWAGYNRQENLTPGLLRANKAIHGEASSLLYSQNGFDFAEATSEEVVLFLEQIGSNNASYIRRIFIAFPTFLYLHPDDVALEEGSVSILTNIQRHCTNLNTLTTSLYSTNAMELKLDNQDNHKVATEALKLVDAHFRAISSLQEIILEVYEDGPTDHIRREMKNHGWTINTTEYVEEEDWGRSFSDDYDDYDDDEYDIDNDSDFWRRAAD